MWKYEMHQTLIGFTCVELIEKYQGSYVSKKSRTKAVCTLCLFHSEQVRPVKFTRSPVNAREIRQQKNPPLPVSSSLIYKIDVNTTYLRQKSVINNHTRNMFWSQQVKLSHDTTCSSGIVCWPVGTDKLTRNFQLQKFGVLQKSKDLKIAKSTICGLKIKNFC